MSTAGKLAALLGRRLLTEESRGHRFFPVTLHRALATRQIATRTRVEDFGKKAVFTSSQAGLLLLSPASASFPQTSPTLSVRWKSKRARGGHSKVEEDEGDEEWDQLDDDNDPGKDYKDLTCRVPSLRLEHVLKAGLGLSRSKVDNAFFASRIRVNGERLLKKAVQVHVGEEVDVIRQVNSKNDKFLEVSRVVLRDVHVVKADEDDGNEPGFRVRLRKFKLLVIENYPDDPWTPQ